MTERISTGDIDKLILQWHRGATTVQLEGFQAWALALFKPYLRFDHAIWGLGAGVAGASVRINSVHLQNTSPELRKEFEGALADDPLIVESTVAPGRVVNVCLADAQWSDKRYDALRAYAARFGFTNAMCVCTADGHSSAMQYVTLGRDGSGDRFQRGETQDFELLAPHMMQAFATRREISVAAPSGRNGKALTWATALVDTAGTVHDHDARFPAMLRLEWNDWPGIVLPDALRSLMQRKTSSRWRFVGEQIVAEFSPVHDLFLMAARSRRRDDALSERERKIARHYASGASYKEIAKTLHVAPATVRAHVRNVYLKLGVNKKAHLARLVD
jgi:DNA-binding CsgD family transcriptional regulator